MEKPEGVVGEPLVIGSVEEAYRFFDQIPNFEFSTVEIYENSQDRGWIPAMWMWFEPLNDKGYASAGLEAYHIKRQTGFKEWGLGKRVEMIFDYWKENDYDAAFFVNPESRKLLSNWNEEGKLEENLEKLETRGIGAHLVRLLTHEQAPACSDFALVMMKLLSRIETEKVKNIYFNQIGDGDEQAQFWTFAPYIFEALRRNRVIEGKPNDDTDDLLKIMMWLRSRKRDGEWGSDAVFAGIGELRRLMDKLLLPRNGFHPVHKYVERVGEHIASYLEKITVDENVVWAEGEIRRV